MRSPMLHLVQQISQRHFPINQANIYVHHRRPGFYNIDIDKCQVCGQVRQDCMLTSLKDFDKNVSGLLMGLVDRPGLSCILVRGLFNSNRLMEKQGTNRKVNITQCYQQSEKVPVIVCVLTFESGFEYFKIVEMFMLPVRNTANIVKTFPWSQIQNEHPFGFRRSPFNW